jgi:methylmalonyl-CoA mutase
MSTTARHIPAPGPSAEINIMRRLIQAQGAEVVHLGHNRSVEDVVRAALQEDADAIALSSYQGGHVEYFKYMVDMLKQRGAPHIKVFGGGGGTITPEEIAELQAYGVERIYHPNDGMHMGLTAHEARAHTSPRSPTASPPSSASRAPAAPASRAWSTSSCCASCSRFRRCASRCWRSIRPGAAPAARCSATASA